MVLTTLFAFISQRTPRHVSHGAGSLPTLQHGPDSYTLQQTGFASLAPLPRLLPTSPRAHSPQDFWAGTPRMPLSCINCINSFNPVFVAIF